MSRSAVVDCMGASIDEDISLEGLLLDETADAAVGCACPGTFLIC